MGIDPGASGGLVISDNDEIHVVRFKNETPHDIAAWLAMYSPMLGFTENVRAVFEKVHAMPSQGVVSTFSFGESVGMIKGLLTAYKIPYVEVTPQKWVKSYGMSKGKFESITDWKNRLKAKAQEMYPDMKITLDVADAILIMHYNKNTEKW
jgi:hypothetical protein